MGFKISDKPVFKEQKKNNWKEHALGYHTYT